MPPLPSEQRITRHRVDRLSELLLLVQPVPDEWLEEGPRDSCGRALECLPCSSWAELVEAWEDALRWMDGLDRALSVMLASVASVRMPGDQLWVRVVSPPATGKSVLCEALSVNKRWVYPRSTFRGFHSGVLSDKEGSKDHSIISKIADKTFIIKDGDATMSSPNWPQIMAEGRDLYDTTSRAHYRHGVSRNYEGKRMTWLFCGTETVRRMDASELGERFLDTVIVDVIDDELEDDIGWRAVQRVYSSRAVEANGDIRTHNDEYLNRAMQLTGGYVDCLRDNASHLLGQVSLSDGAAQMIMNWGKFVAYTRTRPSKVQDESIGREMSTRLRIQLVRLALCLAVVLNRTAITEDSGDDVMRRVRAVALDTSRGRTLEIIRVLNGRGDTGMETRSLALACGRTVDKKTVMMTFLKQLGVVESFDPVVVSGDKVVTLRSRWRLTPRLHRLYREIIE